MKTLLDDGYTWFLDTLGYRGGCLTMVLAEGFRAAGPEDIEIAGVMLRGSYAIRARADSRRVEIRFERLVAWQCVDESWTTFDEYEERDDLNKLQVLARSRYLDHVNASHGWYAEMVGPAAHYRVWMEDEVIEVVSFDPPSLSTPPA